MVMKAFLRRSGGGGGGASSALETLVASMDAGEFQQLSVTGMKAAFGNTAGATNRCVPYCESFPWDATAKRFYSLGSDHNGNNTPGVNATYRFNQYDEATNTFTTLANPDWVELCITCDPQIYTDAHGYDMTTFDPSARIIYRRPYNSSTYHIYDVVTETWDTIPVNSFGEGGAIVAGLSWFPERGTLISGVTNQISEFDPDDDSWTQLATGTGMDSTWLQAAHNPIKHCVIIASTANNGRMKRVNSDGSVVALNDWGVPLYDGSGYVGSYVVCPVSGDGLVMGAKAENRDFYIHDVDADTYTLNSTQPPASFVDAFVCPVQCDTHGVILYNVFPTSADSEPEFWVYKHA